MLTDGHARRRQKEKDAICAADDGSAPPLHLLQRSERQTKVAAYPWGALHATEHLGPGSAFRQMKAGISSGPGSLALQHQHAWRLPALQVQAIGRSSRQCILQHALHGTEYLGL